MANLFDEKEMWEEAIAVLEEVAPEYRKTFEYGKLAELSVRIVLCFEK